MTYWFPGLLQPNDLCALPLSVLLCVVSSWLKVFHTVQYLQYTETHYSSSLIPRPSHPSVCHLQYQCGVRPGKTWVTCSDVPGRVEKWHIPGKTAGKWVHYRSQIRTLQWLSVRHQTVLAMFLGFRKPLCSCTEGMCHSSIRPGTSLHVTPFYQAFPHVSTASDKCWGEKAWVWGYHSSGYSIQHKYWVSLLNVVIPFSR